MDLDAYWQENKRFVLAVGGGVVLFFVGFAVETAMFEDEILAAQRTAQKYRNDLKAAQYTAQDLAQVEEENAALKASVERLTAAASFQPRPEFVHDPASGSVANHYLRTFSRVREDLEQRANRAGLTLDEALGMPELSPTVESEIVRYLEALDVVESVADLAIRARVKRMEKIQVRLDPARSSRQGVGPIERTRVQLSLAGSSAAIARVLAWTQRPETSDGQGGRVLAIDQLETSRAAGKAGEVRLDVTFVIARVKPAESI
jgi:hypothetical protein